MKESILDKVGRKSGETVPDGYFEQFKTQMKLELPEREWPHAEDSDAVPGSRTWWERVRPYVYMAAMFAGVWLMMNMFSFFPQTSRGDMMSNPSLIAALGDDTFFNDYVTSDLDDYDLYDNLYDSGFDPETMRNWE